MPHELDSLSHQLTQRADLLHVERREKKQLLLIFSVFVRLFQLQCSAQVNAIDRASSVCVCVWLYVRVRGQSLLLNY